MIDNDARLFYLIIPTLRSNIFNKGVFEKKIKIKLQDFFHKSFPIDLKCDPECYTLSFKIIFWVFQNRFRLKWPKIKESYF